MTRAVVVMYNLDGVAQDAYQKLHSAWDSVQNAGGTWHINEAAAVLDRKYHAGASNVVKRKTINIRKGEPPIVKTNVEIVIVPAGRQLLAFMPDRLLVFDGGNVAGIDYGNVNLVVTQRQFIEDETPPGDAKIVGFSWRYVNKNGGPDRRFANNAQLPVALYEELHLKSSSGLNELFQCSRLEVGKSIQEALAELVSIASEKK